MELTKEYFDQVIAGLATKQHVVESIAGLATKQDLERTEVRLVKRIDEAQEELAQIIADTIAAPFKKRFDELEELLEVKEDVLTLKRQMLEIRSALHLTS